MTKPLFGPADPGQLLPLVRRFAQEEGLLPPTGRVLVAVSGGPDSVALLHLLERLRPKWGLHLGVAHFDHGLRGEASREEARFVTALARDLGLPVYLGLGDVRQLAQAEKISLQMAARRLRFDFLDEVRRDHAYDHLALGHTADDQVELFFLRLLRGAGSEGLKGMWPRTAGGVVRPLLAAGKEVVLAWLQQENLPYREDLSNLSRRYLRNRLRLDLLPALMRDYNPRLKTAIWRLMSLLQEDERLLAETAGQAWDGVGRWVTPGLAVLSIPPLLDLPAGLETRLLRLTLGRFLTHQEITSAQVKTLSALARGQKSGGALIWGSCQVARAGAELHFFRPLPPPPAHPFARLPGVGIVEHPAGWRLQAKNLPDPPWAPGPASPGTVWIDQGKAPFPLTLRLSLPGDRFWPEGAPGTKKMQDFLVDAKIPRWLRPHLPMVASGDRIVWVPGLRLADPAKLTPTSRVALELSISPANPTTTRVWELMLAWRQEKTRTA